MSNHKIYKGLSLSQIKACQSNVEQLLTKLTQGSSVWALGGKRLVVSSGLIRFKFGEYRFIVENTNSGFIPIKVIQRKDLEKFIKRRCH